MPHIFTVTEPTHRISETPIESSGNGSEAAPLHMRIIWYGVAAVVTIPLNPALFALFHDVLGWVNYAAYAVSLTLVNVLQFLWSFFIGFRTHESWTTSARRQGVALVVFNLLNYALVIVLQAVFPMFEKAIIVGVQVAVAIVKFVVYHYWVYPERAVQVAEGEK
ncbi:MAG: hypothetical protein K8R23_02365 [Chthoniobacter sp.]|nr:hypothetical protein [Chthoniobacter sp.]